ncbi:MAG: hypothetical protein ACI9UV_002649 [Algoriphagus sp.]|jgi:hypothetical protein
MSLSIAQEKNENTEAKYIESGEFSARFSNLIPINSLTQIYEPEKALGGLKWGRGVC